MKNITISESMRMKLLIEALGNIDGGDLLDRDPDTKKRVSPEKPKMFRAILHNDNDVNGMLVVAILAKFFNKDQTESIKIMMDAHTNGKATIGVYSKDEAETRVSEAVKASMDSPLGSKNPVMMTVEPD